MSHPQVLGADVQPGAHVQEVRHAVVVQQDVDGHRAAPGGVHQVLQDLEVGEQVHHDGDHLLGAQKRHSVNRR